jgi:hypothetical protein
MILAQISLQKFVFAVHGPLCMFFFLLPFVLPTKGKPRKNYILLEFSMKVTVFVE